MTPKTHSKALLNRLTAAGIEGAISSPGEPGWDLARQSWNLANDQRPIAVVFPNNPQDIQRVVAVAGETGSQIVTQGTGHGAFFYDTLENTILIRTTRLNGLEVDSRTIRADAGVLWGEVAVEAGRLGRAALHGSSPDVGVGGYILGGGIGWLSRRYGIAANSVKAIELVTADGVLRRVNGGTDPELFWALRGGGGGLGVLTSVELRTFPVSSLYAGTLVWDSSHGRDLFEAWGAWTQGLEDDTTSILRFLNLPPLPGVPEVLAGHRVVTLGAASVGSIGKASKAIDVMRDVAQPLLDTFDIMTVAGLARLHGDPEQPTPGLTHHSLLSRVDAEVAETMDLVMGPASANPLISLEIRHLGGAIARPPKDAGALSHIEPHYLAEAVGLTMTPEEGPIIHEVLTDTIDHLHEWREGTYLNFSERSTDSTPFDETTTRRLADVKQRVDPNGTFRMRGLFETELRGEL